MRLGVRAALVDGEVVPGDVTVDEDSITAVGVAPAGSAGMAVPGFVDLQVNGFAGVDFAMPGPDGYRIAADAMAATGVTAFQPTLISLPEAAYAPALAAAADARHELAIRLLGVHLEGPFLSRACCGAHDATNIVDPDPELADRLLAAGPVTHITIAPERPGALDLIRALAGRGMTVACGHSAASAAEAHAAFDAGARAVTHLFNAQLPWGHREPGLAGAALSRDGVTVTAIVDGIHLAAETVRVAHRAAAGRFALITDAIAATGLGDGVYPLGDRTVHVVAAEARLADGTLAGSLLTMDRAVRNLADLLDGDVAAAVAAATDVPARLAGRAELGTLAPGTPADIAVLSDDLGVTRTLVAGAEVYGG